MLSWKFIRTFLFFWIIFFLPGCYSEVVAILWSLQARNCVIFFWDLFLIFWGFGPELFFYFFQNFLFPFSPDVIPSQSQLPGNVWVGQHGIVSRSDLIFCLFCPFQCFLFGFYFVLIFIFDLLFLWPARNCVMVSFDF